MMQQLAVPVDTTGNGIADHIGYDTNNDGRLDSFQPVVHQPPQMVVMLQQQQQTGPSTLYIEVYYHGSHSPILL